MDKRIASARENAAKVAAAHARAQADLLSFLDREKEEAEKRRVETANRRAMDSERAQNRQRKLKAVTGREWDATKQEEDYAPRGRGYRRGMHGAVTGHTHRDFEAKHHEGPARNQGGTRGRKGKGGRRGSSRGSASTSDRASGEAAAEPAPPAAPAMTSETDFPSLGEMKNTLPEDGESKSPVGGSWADQVEAQ